jgi:hypothetical protein
VLFWLNTLCILVAENLVLYRKRAIDSMTQIYASTSKVLVLDPYVQSLPSKITLEEPNFLEMHIRMSDEQKLATPRGSCCKQAFLSTKRC